MDKDTLHEIELQIFQEIIDFTFYAGNAFLQDDEEQMNLFKGQHMGLMRLQKWVSEKYLRVCQKEDEEEEQKCKYRCAHGHRFNTPSTQPGKDEEMLRCSICGCPHFEVVEKDGNKNVDKQDGKITFAEYLKEGMVMLKDHDHKLFAQIVNGLVMEGWREDGGSYVYRLLSKDGFAIKMFRNEEAPAVIKICFSVEPEEPKIGKPE